MSRLSFEFNLFGLVFSPLNEHYEIALFTVTNDDGASRSLLGVHWQSDMLFVVDVAWFHIKYIT